jgi:tripartite-type tricarboxylate transporter receptor subunit TctC
MTKIPFRGGPQVVQELIAGRVHFYVSPTLAVMPPYQSKQVKILAVTSPERLNNASEIPTLKEKGIDFVRFGWLGICAAAGTPQAIIDRLNRHVVAIVEMPEYRSLIENAGSLALASAPAGLRQVITQTVDDVAASIREFGMQQE